MDIKPIKTDADHEVALRTIEELWGSIEGTPEGDRLEILTTLVEAYEERRWLLPEMDPVEAIEAAMQHEGKNLADLAALIGKSRATEILKRKRALTLPMIRRISEAWNVPERVLVREYEVKRAA